MDYVNNWSRPLTLALGATTAVLDLPDGNYRLTCADGEGRSATRWECIDAVVAGNAATLTRAREGTTPQEWPAGSVVYCAITAGGLADILAQLGGSGDTAQYNSGATLDLSAGVPADFIWLSVPPGNAQAAITLPALSGNGPRGIGISPGDSMQLRKFVILVGGSAGLGGFAQIKITAPPGAQVLCSAASTTPDEGRSAVFAAGPETRIEVELFSDYVLLTVTPLSFPDQPDQPI